MPVWIARHAADAITVARIALTPIFLWTIVRGEAGEMGVLAAALFAVIAVLLVLIVRPRMRFREGDAINLNQRMYDYVGRFYVLHEAIVNGRGKVRIDDTLWVVTGSDRDKGEWVKVTAVDGTRLIVEPAGEPG